VSNLTSDLLRLILYCCQLIFLSKSLTLKLQTLRRTAYRAKPNFYQSESYLAALLVVADCTTFVDDSVDGCETYDGWTHWLCSKFVKIFPY
jgi:hypothetical protein